MHRLRRLYGGSPGHLAALVLGGVLSAYAVSQIRLSVLPSILLWFGFLLIAHDLLLFPAYAALDRVLTRARGMFPSSRRVPVTNHVRVPVVLSAVLFIAWFPLILRLPRAYEPATGRTTDVFLGHWLAVTAALFAVSAVMYAGRLVRDRRHGAPEA
jgi:hypothetical protein